MQGKCQDLSDDASYQLMDSLIEPTHILRRIDTEIDFSFVDLATESLFSPNRGRASIPPQQYFKMQLIKHWFNIPSIKKLLEAMQHNIAYRWFCGFRLEEKLPDPSSFTNLTKRFGPDAFKKFFNAILQQCIDKGLVTSDSVMTDSTLFNANAAINSLERKDKENESKFKRKLSNKTHQSTTDPDATLAFKAGTSRALKYKAHVCINSSSRVITHIKITSGAVHESGILLEQLEQLQAWNIEVSEVIADKAYGTGDILTQLHDRNIHSNIPLFSSRSGSSKKTDILGFVFDSDNNQYHCPENKTFNPCHKKDGNYTIYLSKSSDCASCPQASSCKAPRKSKGKQRVLVRNDYYELFETIKKQMTTQIFKEKLYQRMCRIEGVMNELKNVHGLNRAHYRRLANVQIQGYMAAMAINIKRIIFYWLCIILLFVVLF